MSYRMTLEDAQPIADAIANMPQGVSRGDAVIDAIEAIVSREVAAALAPVETLADEWAEEGKALVFHAHSGGDVYEGETLARCARDLRAVLGESR